MKLNSTYNSETSPTSWTFRTSCYPLSCITRGLSSNSPRAVPTKSTLRRPLPNGSTPTPPALECEPIPPTTTDDCPNAANSRLAPLAAGRVRRRFPRTRRLDLATSRSVRCRASNPWRSACVVRKPPWRCRLLRPLTPRPPGLRCPGTRPGTAYRWRPLARNRRKNVRLKVCFCLCLSKNAFDVIVIVTYCNCNCSCNCNCNCNCSCNWYSDKLNELLNLYWK